MAGPGEVIDQAVAQLCDQLQAALREAAPAEGRGGIIVSTDPGRIERGGAWVSPREAQLVTLAGGYEVTTYLWLVAADVDEPTARRQLSRALDVVGPLVELAPDEPIDLASSIALPNNPTTRLPAYRLVIIIETE